MFARKLLQSIGFAALSMISCSPSAFGVAYTWNVTNAGGNWNDPSWNGGVAGPTSPGDSAFIDNNTPSAWPAGTTQTININVPINIDQLNFTDNQPPNNQIMILRVSADSTIQTINWFNDAIGSGRSRYQIDAGRTLSVNNLQFTGRFPDPNISGGTLKYIGASATFGYFGGTEQFGSNHAIDFTTPTTMNVTRNGGSAELEGRDNSWVVGNASANQTWVVTGGQLVLDQRSAGGGWNFHKVGANDVDMSGVKLQRNVTLAGGSSLQTRNLFTTTSGTATAGGVVRIGAYRWIEQSASSAPNDLQLEKIGSSLTIANGGEFRIDGFNAVNHNDVDLVQVLAGKTLKVEGAATGNLIINDSASPLSTGRMGIHFEGGALDVDHNLQLLGSNTFLNGGTTGGTINVGGNVTVQSQNASGFATVTNLSSGLTSTADDFDLRASSLIFDGGTAQSMDWNVNATALGSAPALTVGAFSLNNFTIGTLQITNNSNVTLTAGEVVYLSKDLIIDSGSTLTISSMTSELHILDPDMSEFARISGYLGNRLLAPGLGFFVTDGVGYSLSVLPAPEPSSCSLLGLGLVFLARRKRRVALK